MQQNINYQALTEKWAPLLDYEGVDKITDAHRRNVTAVLLENQEQMLREENSFQSLTEASPTNSAGTGGFSGSSAEAGPVAGFDPVLISLIRRAMPNLVAYDLAGVQPMSGPTGLIFASQGVLATRIRVEQKLYSTSQIQHSLDRTALRTSQEDSQTPLLVSVLLHSLVLTHLFLTQSVLQQPLPTT